VGGEEGRFLVDAGFVYRERFESVPLGVFLGRIAGAPGIRIPADLWREAALAVAPRSAAAPSIASLSPNKGAAHMDHLRPSYEAAGCAQDSTLVTITGANFGATQGTGRVDFFEDDGYWQRGCVDFWSDTMIRVRVPG